MYMGVGSILRILSHVRILRSQSLDPFYNLALEDLIFQNNNFTSHPIILFWQNSPSVFIGRFQNPWKEANVSFLNKYNIPLARRSSGGGAVFHDLGNCNFTVFSNRSSYNRNRNLEFLCQVLRKYFSIPCDVTKKSDIVYKGFKVSGTACRIVRDKVYHHFTLLLSSDVESLRKSLHSPLSSLIKTNATPSLPSPTINLSSINSILNPVSLYEAFSNEILVPENAIMDIPADINEISSETRFRSWDWVFGATPKFVITLPNSSIELTVEKGVISRLGGDGTGILEPLLQTPLSCKEFLPKFETLKRKYTESYVLFDRFNILIQNLPEN